MIKGKKNSKQKMHLYVLMYLNFHFLCVATIHKINDHGRGRLKPFSWNDLIIICTVVIEAYLQG